ncbi:MAG: hypothetical protein WCI50_06070 [Actinomycetes bacterium]
MRLVDCTLHIAPGAQAALDRLEQVEDVGFSPSGRRLALSGYANDSLAVAEVRIDRDDVRTRVTVGPVAHVVDARLAAPHGVCFLDESTLAVANRDGDLVLFHIPADLTTVAALEPVAVTGTGFTGLAGPSSVTTAPGPDGTTVLLVCNTHGRRVTRHTLHRLADGTIDRVDNGIAVDHRLDIPDGATVSPDGRWLAVSNHRHHLVMVYDFSAVLDGRDEPVAVLRGAAYPHALQFVAGGRALLASDAGRPELHLFVAAPDGWRGVVYPSRSQQVLDDASFADGRMNSREGGIKGLALHPDGRLLALSARQRSIAFADLSVECEPVAPDERARLAHELALIDENVEWRRLDAAYGEPSVPAPRTTTPAPAAPKKPRPTNRERTRWVVTRARRRLAR